MGDIITRIDPAKFKPSECVDCRAIVMVGTLVEENGSTDFVIIHTGEGCGGFNKRFSAPGSTTAYNERGDKVQQVREKKQLPK